MRTKNNHSDGKQNNDGWIYGKHAVKAALQNKKRKIFRFVMLESVADYFKDIKNIKPEIVNAEFFQAKFGKNATHQGCAVQVGKLSEIFIEDLLEDENDLRPFVFLDQVTDPQNVGSIMRAGAVFGARAVVVPENSSPELSPAIIKAASGAAEIVPLIRVTNLVQTINKLKKEGFWCVGLDERGEKTLSRTDLKGKIIIVIGSEGDGMRRLTKESCDFLVQLPFADNFSTLNAAQAATVSLYEVLRQQQN